MEVPARVYRPRLHRPRKCPGGGVTLKLGVSDMQIENIAIDRLSISKAIMRQGKKPPDVSDILPSIIKRGVIIPVIVRPNCNEGHFEICAGKRRFYASLAAQPAGKDGWEEGRERKEWD